MSRLPLILCACLLVVAACRFSGEPLLSNTEAEPTAAPFPPVQTPLEASFNCREVAPSETDESITQWDQPHYICLPDSPTLESGRLFVFLPGTGATPDYYTELMHAAAITGLHVIDLRYPNDESVNLQLCPRDTDPDCHEKVRREILSGVDLSKHVSVNPANSIEGRLGSLLFLLAGQYPEEGWEQFLDEAGAPIWASVVVAGHSQGGGHAVYLAQEHLVDHAVAFAWVDVRRGELAPWLLNNLSQTPPEGYYLFWHQDDDKVARHQEKLMVALGIDSFGDPAIVDGNAPPFEGSHGLVASNPAPEGERAHNTHAADKALVFDPNGDPIYKGVWQFLLSADGQAQVSSTSPRPDIRVGSAVRIGAPGTSYIDPEFYQPENLVTFADEERRAWLGVLDPVSGEFVSANGQDTLVDEDLTPLSVSFNAPEFGVDREGWALYYTKDLESVPQVWRAAIGPAGVTNTSLTSGSIDRLSALASKDPTLPAVRLLYALGGFSPLEGRIAWMNESDPQGAESVLAPVDRGVRWIDNTSSFAYVDSSGAEAGQIMLYDTEKGASRIITDTPGRKSFAYGWLAPEYNEILVMAVVDDARIEVFRDEGHAFWVRIATLEIPGSSPYSLIGSPEAFAAGGESYISLVTKATAGYSKAQVWVFGILDEKSSFRLLCDDSQGEVIRSDPESFIGEQQVFIYYNILRTGLFGRQNFDLYKCSTGIRP